MAYKVLYRKYRPTNFENVVGQEYTISILKNEIINNKTSHAYIFTGPRGTGKTSTAKIFSKALNCEHPIDGSPCNECSACKAFDLSPDIIEIDAASNNGVDEIRELINNVKLVPTSLKYKVYIIDEVHMLTASAFNALLLTLEEPPEHVVFILATTDIQNVPITILSRCQRFDFKPVSKEAIINRLKEISKLEKIKIDNDALEEIALLSAGGMRDALGILDQLSSMGNKITLNEISKNFGSVSKKKIDELLTAIFDNEINKIVDILGNIRESGTNYTVFIEKLIMELRVYAIDVKSGNRVINFSFENIYKLIFDLNDCLSNININIDPYILIEIVLLKYVDSGNNLNYPSKEIVDLGNNNEEKKDAIREIKLSDEGNKEEKKEIVSNTIDLNVRVNNCFVSAAKTLKNEVSKSWIEFMNYLMNVDRNFVSLLADTVILAASDKYILIQSKIESTNDLINDQIKKLEKYYYEFSNNLYLFAAINENLWKKEVEKYRFNVKNKIKYNYIEENIEEDIILKESDENITEIEKIANDIFDSYEVE